MPCYGLLELPKDLAAWSVAPLLLKHLLLALGKLHLDLPFPIQNELLRQKPQAAVGEKGEPTLAKIQIGLQLSVA